MGLALAQIQANDLGIRGLPETASSVEALARRAVALDGADAEARSLLCFQLWRRGDYEGALAEAERALATAPNLAFAHHMLGATLIHSGRPKEGLAAIERSIRLDPRAQQSAGRLNHVAMGSYLCHDYEAAIAAARRAIREHCVPKHISVARRGARSTRPDRGSKGGAREGHRGRASSFRDVCPPPRAVAPAGRPRPHGRGPAQGRDAGGVRPSLRSIHDPAPRGGGHRREPTVRSWGTRTGAFLTHFGGVFGRFSAGFPRWPKAARSLATPGLTHRKDWRPTGK